MFSLKSIFYEKKFATLDLLLVDIVLSKADPFHEILVDGQGTGEVAANLLKF
jgi:hypothetical protein